MTIFLAILGLPVLWVIGVFLNAWAITKLWTWFIVPPFNAPELTYGYAAGIALLIQSLTFQRDKCQKDEGEKEYGWFIDIFMLLIKPLFIVFCGWCIKHIFL